MSVTLGPDFLRCCSKTIKNTLVNHIATLGDILIPHEKRDLAPEAENKQHFSLTFPG